MDETPNRRNVLNLTSSLRPKTIQSTTNVKKTEHRKLLRHKSVEERSLGLYANTFTSIPSFKTPPSCGKKGVAFNPFNVGLREKLECSTLSPNIFSTVLSPSQNSEEIRWTIEDLSSMKPAPIEENMEPVSEPEDPHVQEVIDKYFLETHMVPSPFDAPNNWVKQRSAGRTPLFSRISKHAVASTPRSDSDGIVRVRNVMVQTALSLPPTLPEHVEAVLKPFFSAIEDGELEENNLSGSSMRRKLFFHKDDEQLSPVKCNNETYSQNIEHFTPKNSFQIQDSRHFTPIASSQGLLQPDISPIEVERSSINVSKSRVRLEFPDTCNNAFSKGEGHEESVDRVINNNNFIDEPMMVSVIDNSIFHEKKKQRNASDRNVTKPLTSTISSDKGSVATPASNPSIFEDVGYCTNEDMSWRQSFPMKNDREKVSALPISFLASTPTKKELDEIF